MRSLLGGGWPTAAGWGLALLAALLLLVVDASAKWFFGRRREFGLR
jgi:hypothetical protein